MAPWEGERLARVVWFGAAAAGEAIRELAEPNKGERRWDCIVVGAGPAGSTAAFALARAGMRVLLLERGPYPGAKNVGGGALYSRLVEPLFPHLWREAPLEGAIVHQSFHLLTSREAVTVGVTNPAFAAPPFNRFSVLKARFDPWLAGEAVRAGACLLVNTLADRLLCEGGRVTGVRALGPWAREFHAPVTILAEGATSWLASRAGLIPRWRPEHLSLYVKEVMALPAAVIRERFGLGDGEAATMGFFGFATGYLPGTASLYTCRDCVGLNAGALLARQRDGRRAAVVFLRQLKAHPLLRPLLEGGRTVEFSAHLIPDGGYPSLPEVVHDGCLLVGDAAGLVNGTHGITNAVYSAKLAADAVLAAAERGDFSRRGLASYRELLAASPVLRDLRAQADAPSFWNRFPHFADLYPRLLACLATEVATVYPLPKLAKRRHLWRQVRAVRPPLRLARDLAAALKALW